MRLGEIGIELERALQFLLRGVEEILLLERKPEMPRLPEEPSGPPQRVRRSKPDPRQLELLLPISGDKKGTAKGKAPAIPKDLHQAV